MRKILFITAFLACASVNAQKQLPLVYDVEDTGASLPLPATPEASELPLVYTLRNPLLFQNGKKKVKKFKDWRRRRHEISSLIQHYEIGTKPKASECDLKARMDGDTLIAVRVQRGAETVLVTKDHYALRFPTSDVSLYKKTSVGVRGLKLQPGDEITDVYDFDPKERYVVRIGKKAVDLGKLKLKKRDQKPDLVK